MLRCPQEKEERLESAAPGLGVSGYPESSQTQKALFLLPSLFEKSLAESSPVSPRGCRWGQCLKRREAGPGQLMLSGAQTAEQGFPNDILIYRAPCSQKGWEGSQGGPGGTSTTPLTAIQIGKIDTEMPSEKVLPNSDGRAATAPNIHN